MKQRDIKFRAWIPTEETMFYQNGQYLQSFLRRANFASTGYGHDSYGTPHLMQWTGLQDKNGKPIYEGDIVEWWDSYGVSELGNDSFSTRAVVVFNDGGFDPVVGLTGVEIEVMGNIYQNPDLLNETTN